MRILSIETSCDETAIAIIEYNNGSGLTQKLTRNYAEKSQRGTTVRVLANIVSSQIEIHKPFGGVVPNLARREHEENLVPILIEALKQARFNLRKSDFLRRGAEYLGSRTSANSKLQMLNGILERESKLLEHFKKQILPLGIPKIDAIAVTYGPGLAPALWVGVNFARALSYIWKVPIIPVNHMEGHIFAAMLQKCVSGVRCQVSGVKYPALALLVSGGHTELVLIKKLGKYKIVGETVDDAAGECFDKVARILDLPYPGGPQIARLAQSAQKNAERTQKIAEKNQRNSALSPRNSARELKLPRPMLHSKDFNFSFSGLKTAVLYLVRDMKANLGKSDLQKQKSEILGRSDFRGDPISTEVKAAIAKEFQNAVVEVLVSKTMRAAEKYKIKTVILGGGVAANKELREKLLQAVNKLSAPTPSLLNKKRRGRGPDRSVGNVRCLLPSPAITGDNALMIALSAAFTGKKIKKPLALRAEANLRLD